MIPVRLVKEKDLRKMCILLNRSETGDATTVAELKENFFHYPEGWFVIEQSRTIVGSVQSLRYTNASFEKSNGILNLDIMPSRNGDKLYVIGLAVASNKKGKGFEKCLLEKVIWQARDHGVSKVMGVATEDLKGIYSDLKFKTVRNLHGFMPNRTCTEMELLINSSKDQDERPLPNRKSHKKTT